MFSSCDIPQGSPVWGLLLFLLYLFYFSFYFCQVTPRDVPPCSCLPLSLFDLIAVLPSLLLHFVSLCGALVVFVIVFLSGLSCTAYMVAFLALRVSYGVVLGLFRFCFLAFPLEFLPGDDVLCRLLSRPLPSVCFLPCLFVLFCFPTVFVLDFFWCNFLYLVTTAGFVADQLIM